jgi:CRISPR-associated endonuclease/helicase Cas3
MASLCEGFFSHPGIKLYEHLSFVGTKAQNVIKQQGIEDPLLLKCAEIIGKTHDFGKYTKYFQNKLKGKEKIKESLTYHAPLSALFGSWLVSKETDNGLLTLASLIAILHHHGSLTMESIDDVISWIEEFSRSEEAKKQVRSIQECLKQIEFELSLIGIIGLGEFIRDFNSEFLTLRKKIRQLREELKSMDSFEVLYKILLLFSVLIYADKSHAGGIEPKRRIELNRNLIDVHKPRTACSDAILWTREQVYCRAVGRVEQLLNSEEIPHVMTITAPTGSGKTATALAVALRIRDYVKRKKGYTPRIIYCLPYINIIEQVHEVISNVLKSGGVADGNELILKHHHLYPAKLNLKDYETNDGREVDKQLMVFDSWDSEIVVTTFVQLFETLLGIRNRMLLKFHKLMGSVIILDEVQTLPMELWVLFRDALKSLSRHSWLILMSATSPSLLCPDNAVELIENYEELYDRLERVAYHYCDRELTIDSAAKFVLEILNGKNVRSVAIVVNTIKASIDLYNAVKGLDMKAVAVIDETCLNSTAGIFLAYLSTNIIPREREKRIKLLERLLFEGKKVLLVCTQVIEAGVDLDFDVIIRDVAPLDCIVQAGGRCNRNGLKSRGDVYIVKLVDANGRPTYPNIYGKLAIEYVTLPLLKDFKESELLQLIRKYFDKVNEVKGLEKSDSSKKFYEYVSDLHLVGLSELKLVGKEEPKVSVFVEIDGNASDALANFRRLLDLKKQNELQDSYKVRAEMRIVRTKLEEFIVETYREDIVPLETIYEGVEVKYLDRSKVQSCYDTETGLIIGSDSTGFVY